MSSKDLSIHIGHEELVIRGRYETASIINDLLFAVWFIVGSVRVCWTPPLNRGGE